MIIRTYVCVWSFTLMAFSPQENFLSQTSILYYKITIKSSLSKIEGTIVFQFLLMFVYVPFYKDVTWYADTLLQIQCSQYTYVNTRNVIKSQNENRQSHNISFAKHKTVLHRGCLVLTFLPINVHTLVYRILNLNWKPSNAVGSGYMAAFFSFLWRRVCYIHTWNRKEKAIWKTEQTMLTQRNGQDA